MKLRVAQMRYEADRVVSLELVDPAGQPLPEWSPGAHVDLVLPSGLVRQYSMCGDPDERCVYRVAVLHDMASRGGSREVHSTVRVGDVLEVRGPRNHFELVPSDRYVFIAGGIGITPILPMVEKAAARGDDWTLYYLGRSRASMGFRERLLRHGDRVTLLPDDEPHGMTLQRIVASAQGASVYCCGPTGLIEAIESTCEQAGMREHCHVERFAPAPSADSGHDSPFTAVLARSGREVEVPSGRSLLQCLIDDGVDMLFSCEEGMCGCCEVKVLEGEPLHCDSVLSERERAAGDRMMVCVSRAKTQRLVLDL
jgi:ferredoxin-NADP reductase